MVELSSGGSRKVRQNDSKTQALARNRRRGLGLNATELLKNFAFELTPEFKQLVSKMDAMLAPLVDENNTISLDEAYAIVEGTGFKVSASQNVNAELLDYFNDNGIQLSYDENATVMSGYITLVASEELASKIALGEVTTVKLGDYDKAIVPSSLSLLETNILASRILLAFLLRFVVS